MWLVSSLFWDSKIKAWLVIKVLRNSKRYKIAYRLYEFTNQERFVAKPWTIFYLFETRLTLLNLNLPWTFRCQTQPGLSTQPTTVVLNLGQKVTMKMRRLTLKVKFKSQGQAMDAKWQARYYLTLRFDIWTWPWGSTGLTQPTHFHGHFEAHVLNY